MLDDYGALIRSGQAIVPDYATQQLNQQMMQMRKMQMQQASEQIAAEREKAAKEKASQQAFQTDLDGVMTNPTAENIGQLILKHPDHADKVKQGWDVMDKGRQQADLRQIGSIYAAGSNGRFDLAAKQMRERVEADKAVDGQADPQDEAILAALESDDPVQQKGALGMIGYMGAAVAGADNWAKLNPTEKPTAFMQNYEYINGKDPALGKAYLEGEANGRPVVGYDANGNPMAVNLGSLPKYQGGGGQASGGGGGSSSPSGRRMGWAPRKRDGGDNSDAAIDGKNSFITKRLGVGVEDQLPRDRMSALFDALAPTEGGAGSIADRNNNPGNIQDGAFAKSQPGYIGAAGGYAKFADKTAGRNAGIALLGKYWDRGQRSVRDIIEGAPTGGKSQGGANAALIRKQAKDAIAAGADPAAVKQRAASMGVTL